ncbi:MAG: hypothetical protein CVU03_12720 [Bacteroidetes bacterium HGW-Bacteroidetes-2]|nr:MAG: hypothetical protein CVU03_12720 [Bacteroidetes bacterium HGW-Bacteroidetes-2]
MYSQNSTSILVNTELAKTPLVKILFFSKDHLIQQLVQNQLDNFEGIPFKLVSSTTMMEFKQLLKSLRPSVIISDFYLENFAGKEALEYSKMIYPEIPYLFIADALCKKKALQYLQAGATDFIQKENIEELPAILFKALRQSEEKNAIKQLKQKKWEDTQRFKSLIEFSNDPVLLYDIDGKIGYVSPAISRVLGYSIQEFVGTNVKKYIHPEDFNSRLLIFESLVNNNQKFVIIEEQRLLHKEGHYIWARAVISDARLKPGIEGFITNFIDISDRKIKTEALKSSFELVKEQNKRMLNFSYIVSHNLRSHSSNMESIIGFLETATDENEKREMLLHLKNVSKSLNETLYNLNEVVSIQSNTTLKVEKIYLLPFINKILLGLSNPVYLSKTKIEINVPENVAILYNKEYLESVLHNIILNSIKYKHPNRNPVITISSIFIDAFLVVSITDNGVGIDLKKNKNKLFGMYKTFHGNKDALGIDLFMSKNQVEAMGGKIEVESKIGESTTFKIYIKK